MKKAMQLFIAACMLTIAATGCSSLSKQGKASGDILYLSKGKIYKHSFAKRESLPFLNTTEYVADFYISPLQQYMASETSASATNGNSSARNLSIYNLNQGQRIRSISPQANKQLRFENWVKPDALFYSEQQSTASEPNYYTFQIQDNQSKNITYDIWLVDKMRSTVLSGDANMKAFVDSVFNIHLINASNHSDKIACKNTERITDMCFSDNGKYLAWLDVREEAGKIWDEVYLYNIGNGKSHLIYGQKAQAKTGKNTMQFSPNANFISVELGGKILLINLSNLQTTSISGTQACWVNKKQLAYIQANNLYLYNLSPGNSELIYNQVDRIAAY